jgi:hypothetical protein
MLGLSIELIFPNEIVLGKAHARERELEKGLYFND